ncbi:hypothetical protein [Sphingomonas baiyangensis]|uniref:Uncharacterized protein n=1 Tax=Sphingomonas baiyangensis TaxID=2572576 RepID=A0A4U1L899_9SPHN|nr:hypothetical protein [Sphingomonas baiyangensis]TKD53187.1 hypothetical protein FBR43_02335 [Sphingomonas baiyangensis]
MSQQFDAALARLRAFRERHAGNATIDTETGLTAADLDTILAGRKATTDLDPGGSLDADDLAGAA